jgi:hypothetical protein
MTETKSWEGNWNAGCSDGPDKKWWNGLMAVGISRKWLMGATPTANFQKLREWPEVDRRADSSLD